MSSSAISPSRQLFWPRCIRTITLTLLILASGPLTLLAIALSFELEDIYFTNAVCHTIADVSVSVLSALALTLHLLCRLGTWRVWVEGLLALTFTMAWCTLGVLAALMSYPAGAYMSFVMCGLVLLHAIGLWTMTKLLPREESFLKLRVCDLGEGGIWLSDAEPGVSEPPVNAAAGV